MAPELRLHHSAHWELPKASLTLVTAAFDLAKSCTQKAGANVEGNHSTQPEEERVLPLMYGSELLSLEPQRSVL